MAQREGELMEHGVIEVLDTPPRIPSTFVEEWMHIFPGSTNSQNENDLTFKDPYAMCRDGIVPDRIGMSCFGFSIRIE